MKDNTYILESMQISSSKPRPGPRRRLLAKNSSNEKAPCWPYSHPVMPMGWTLRQQWYRNMAVSIGKRLAIDAYTLILTLTLIVNRCNADIAAGASTSEEPPHRRFEYKYSFKGPHLAQTDGNIPFWLHSGSKFGANCHQSYSIIRWQIHICCK